MEEAFHALERRILDHLAESTESFAELALAVFAFQFAHNAPFRAFCEALGASPGPGQRWQDVPAVPATAFRNDPPLSACPPEACERVFLTSGTTGEQRGRHYLRDLTLYRASVQTGWPAAGLPTDLPQLFLSRPPERLPESSLGCMFDILQRDSASPPARPWLLNDEGAIERGPLQTASTEGRPILLFATALALRHLFACDPAPPPLPPGSWVFQTGGYKGLDQPYDPAELYADLETRLGVPPARVINEYGMTELSTPSYAVGLAQPHRTPPWLKVRAIDPETNRAAADGQPGHLVFHDLANLNSVAAVRTQDLGCVLDEHTFTLRGRDPSALPRGCSRASDAYLQSS